jgi:hypothetical protein
MFMLIETEVKLKEELKELKVLMDKLYNLMFIQAKEIDLIHYKLFILEDKPKKALEVLELSKNIPLELKELLKKKLDEEISTKEFKEEGEV